MSKGSFNRRHAGHLYSTTAEGPMLPELFQKGALIVAMPATYILLLILEARGCQNYVKIKKARGPTT
jgi:hypothetical protein